MINYKDLLKINEYIAIDIETTGLNADKDSIIEIAALKYAGSYIVDEFVTLINPGCFLQPYITKSPA